PQPRFRLTANRLLRLNHRGRPEIDNHGMPRRSVAYSLDPHLADASALLIAPRGFRRLSRLLADFPEPLLTGFRELQGGVFEIPLEQIGAHGIVIPGVGQCDREKDSHADSEPVVSDNAGLAPGADAIGNVLPVRVTGPGLPTFPHREKPRPDCGHAICTTMRAQAQAARRGVQPASKRSRLRRSRAAAFGSAVNPTRPPSSAGQTERS